MKLKPLEILGLVALGSWLFSKAGNYLSNQIRVGDISYQFGKITPAGALLDLFIPIENLSSVSYPFEYFQGSLFYGEYMLGAVNVPGPVTIPAAGSTTISTQVQLSFANLSQQIVSLLINKQYLNALQVRGTLAASGLKIPITQTLSLV